MRMFLKSLKIFLIVFLVLSVASFLFIQFHIFKPEYPKSLRPPVPPLKFLCNYEEGLNYSKYESAPSDWTPNNKFGLYVYAEDKTFFDLARKLVNSNGGHWGYVLIPFNVDDSDYDKWQRVFDQLNKDELIPVIQLSNLDITKYQRQTKSAATFLNQFIWPIKYRYISVYNEPNAANFWFGHVAPDEYAKVLDYTIDTFKNASPNFFMMNAGFNTSAPNDVDHMDAFDYMKKMNETVPGIFDKLDGWASHSYPQPNFSGNPFNTGRWSIKAYDTELDFLKQVLKVKKVLPVFITETGWAHAEGDVYLSSFLPDSTVGDYFKTAYEKIWLPDERVRAVMPFTILYPNPYDHFSWVNKDKVPYAHYNVVKDMHKIAGQPPTLNQTKLMLNVCNVQN